MEEEAGRGKSEDKCALSCYSDRKTLRGTRICINRNFEETFLFFFYFVKLTENLMGDKALGKFC